MAYSQYQPQDQMVLIGIMGTKGSGKTTAANYFLTKGFVEKSFADCLKRACMEIFLFDEDQVFGTLEKKETPDPRWLDCTPRKILQFVGTDLLRNHLETIMPGLGKNVFIRHFELWYEKNKDQNVVIPDVRFQNEFDFIKKMGGSVIKIERCGENSDVHESETEMQKILLYDYLISNQGTIEELGTKLGTILADITQ